MKLTFLLLLSGLMAISAESYSQLKRLNLNMKDVRIVDVFNEIEEQSDFYFFFKNDEITGIEKVDAQFNNETIDNILSGLLSNTGLNYRIVDRYIVIGPSNNYLESRQDGTKEVHGKVTDTNRQPLPGVSVIIKGTTQGTTTDTEGRFTITNVNSDAVLVFSFVGMKTQEVSVEGKSSFNIVMEEDIVGLEEVVAIGYGTVKKRDLTGSVSSVRDEDLIFGASSSFDQALMGKVAGVQISQTSSEPGGGVSIRIRGASSINAGNEPLYVIDGVPIENMSLVPVGNSAFLGANYNPRNPLNSLNPGDIKSIEILKDASATAIYGSRGANGVVIITTKQGTKQGGNITYDMYTGVQNVAEKLDVLTTREYIDALNTIAADRGESPVFSSQDIAEIGDGTDWQDEIFRPAFIQNHNLSMHGKTGGTSYYTSINYFDQQGVVENTGMKRYVARINLEQEVSERLKVKLNLNNSLVLDNIGDNGVGENANSGAINTAIQYDPTLPIHDVDGSYLLSSDLLLNNPVGVVYEISNKVNTLRLTGAFTVNYKISDNLTANINLGTDQQRVRRDIYNGKGTLNGIANNGVGNIFSAENSNMLGEGTLTYLDQIGENSSFEVVGGLTYQDFSLRTASANNKDFPTDAIGTDNLSFGNPTLATVGSLHSEHSLFSVFGRANFSLLDQFLLTGSIRADASSRFGENNKYGYFPSGAFAWKMDQQSFVPELFDELKLRISWGLTGNQEIDNYTALSTYSISALANLGTTIYNGAEPTRVANPDLKWESTEQFNIGLDAAILGGRINATFDYFIKNTRDMLLNFPLPPSSGFSSTLINIGKMRNRGFEAMLDFNAISNQDFSWNTNIVFATAKNEVLDIGHLDEILVGYIWRAGNSSIIKPGLPLASYYGYRITGIFQTPDEVAGSAQPESQPGFPIFEDVFEDGKINTNDQVVLGSPIPDFTFGFGNTFKYKNVGLEIFFEGQYGNELLNANAIESMYAENFRRNRNANQIADRWTTNNTDAKWPSATDPSLYGGGRISNLVVENASYIRLKNLQFNYTIPVRNSTTINAAQVYISGQNLFTITNYTGFDPDVNGYGQSIFKIDYNAYPIATIWMIGLRIDF